MTIDLNKIQREICEWGQANFGMNKSKDTGQLLFGLCPLLGMQEELGELCHAVLKKHQGIRGFDDKEKYRKFAKDAIGDFMIFAMNFCGYEDFDLEEIIEETWNEVKERNWKKDAQDGGEVPLEQQEMTEQPPASEYFPVGGINLQEAQERLKHFMEQLNIPLPQKASGVGKKAAEAGEQYALGFHVARLLEGLHKQGIQARAIHSPGDAVVIEVDAPIIRISLTDKGEIQVEAVNETPEEKPEPKEKDLTIKPDDPGYKFKSDSYNQNCMQCGKPIYKDNRTGFCADCYYTGTKNIKL